MTDGPDYQRLMDLIRARIASGEYPVNSQIPSTSQWEAAGWSRDVVRGAVTRLEADGILRGHPGKGVFVLATPADVASERADIKTLSERVAAVEQRVRELADRETSRDIAVIDLYGKLGFEYQHDGSTDNATGEAQHGQAQ